MTYTRTEYLMTMIMKLQITFIEKQLFQTKVKLKRIERKMIQDFNMKVIENGNKQS